MAKKNQYGYVYIFTNPSFREDWIKIGKTTDVEVRLKTLDTTALPLPFEKYATLKTIKYEKAENMCIITLKDSLNFVLGTTENFTLPFFILKIPTYFCNCITFISYLCKN